MVPKNRSIQKHLNFVQYALASLVQYRVRTIAIVFSLTTAVFLLGSIVFLSDGLMREATIAAESSPDITVQGMINGRVTPLSMYYAPKIEDIPGVESVVPRMWGYVLYNNSIYTIMGLEPGSLDAPTISGLFLESGRFPDLAAVNEATGEVSEAVIGSNLAESENLRLNSTFEVIDLMNPSVLPSGTMSEASVAPNKTFTVVGIFSADVSLYTADMILVKYSDAQRLLTQTRGAIATDLGVTVTNPADTGSVAAAIARQFPELRILTKDSIVDATSTTYGLRGGFATVVWFLVLATVILVAWNQASTVGQDSRREVGILKTLGFGTSDILEIRLIEAVALGFISASIGVALAIVYDTYLGAPFLREFMLGWSATFTTFKVPLEVSSGRMLLLYAIAVFPLLLGSLVPAWLSAITEPDTVLRGS